MADNLKTKVDKLVVYGNEQLASKGISEQQSTIRDVLDKISDIQAGGSPSTQAQNIFTGWTMPLTYLNSTDNVFVYESKTHIITITGLDAVGTISDNGTNKVTVTMNVAGTSNTQTPFTITCVKDTETLTYNGLAFHYGSELANGNCLAVAQTLAGTPLDIGYIFIESNSLPSFINADTLWNNIYAYQIMTFSFGRWSGTSTANYFLDYCYSFNQPLTIPNGVTSIGGYFLSSCQAFNQPLIIPSEVTSIGNSFLYYCYSFNQPLTIPNGVTSIGNNFLAYCYSFNQPITIPSGVTSIGNNFLAYCYSLIKLEYNASVYPVDDYSLSQTINSKTSSNGTGILIIGTNANELKNSLPDRTANPYRKLVIQE